MRRSKDQSELFRKASWTSSWSGDSSEAEVESSNDCNAARSRSLEGILQDEFNLRWYSIWCQRRHVDENLAFLVSLQALEAMDDEKERRKAAQAIYLTFIEEASRCEINLSRSYRDDIGENLESSSDSVSPRLFHAARSEVFRGLLISFDEWLESEQHQEMQNLILETQKRVFGAEEISKFQEQEPVKRVLHNAELKTVLSVLQNPFWWERNDSENVTVISNICRKPADEAKGGTVTIFERHVTTRIAGITFKNKMSASQFQDFETSACIWVHFRDVEGGINLICRFHVLSMSPLPGCIVVEREWVHATVVSKVLMTLAKGKVLKVRKAHLELLETKCGM